MDLQVLKGRIIAQFTVANLSIKRDKIIDRSEMLYRICGLLTQGGYSSVVEPLVANENVDSSNLFTRSKF